MNRTRIEYVDMTVNPFVGCSACSPGCGHCYAERFAKRLSCNPRAGSKYSGVVDANGKWTGRINFEGWGKSFAKLPRKPARIFLGSMTDVFHEHIPDDTVHEMLEKINGDWPQHTFLLLTKRPTRAKDILAQHDFMDNVWLGVSVCTQTEANEKIPVLLQIEQTMKRFVSIEPMLGPINLQTVYARDWNYCDSCGWCGPLDATEFERDKNGRMLMICPLCGNDGLQGDIGNIQEKAFLSGQMTLPGIDWIICGGETGPGARPMKPEWVYALRDNCIEGKIPFFFKSWGGRLKGDALVDGVEWRQMPEEWAHSW